MGVSNPGRTYGGYSGGFNWSHEARVAGQIARATPAERKQWNDYIDKMRSEQVSEPSERIEGLDDEIDAALAARNGKETSKSWLPFKVGENYRTIDGTRAICEDIYINSGLINGGYAIFSIEGLQHHSKRYRFETYLSGSGKIIGPWAEELCGRTPPKGFQWTGEYRLPVKGDYFTPYKNGGIDWSDFSECDDSSQHKYEKDKRYILIKLPKA